MVCVFGPVFPKFVVSGPQETIHELPTVLTMRRRTKSQYAAQVAGFVPIQGDSPRQPAPGRVGRGLEGHFNEEGENLGSQDK